MLKKMTIYLLATVLSFSCTGGAIWAAESPEGRVAVISRTMEAADLQIKSSSVQTTDRLGGVLDFDDAGITLTVPTGAFNTETNLMLQEVRVSGTDIMFEDGSTFARDFETNTEKLEVIGGVYNVAANQPLSKPMEAVFKFDPSNMTEEGRMTAGVYYLNLAAGKWVYVPGKLDTRRWTLTVTLNQLGAYAVTSYSKTFNDMMFSWAKPYVDTLASRHIINGITDEFFYPNKNMTRAEFAKVIVSALGIFGTAPNNSFTDVSKSAWYAHYVELAKMNGIVTGYKDGTFKPNAPISRQELAVMIMNAYNYKKNLTGKEVYSYKAVYGDTTLYFADSVRIATWAQPAVAGAKDLGIIGGKDGNLFDPAALATRAEVSKMVYTLIELK